MIIIAILAALGLEQWRAFHWRVAMEGRFIHYARGVERKLNDGTAQHGLVDAAAFVEQRCEGGAGEQLLQGLEDLRLPRRAQPAVLKQLEKAGAVQPAEPG